MNKIWKEILCCPECKGNLKISKDIKCLRCKRTYEIVHEIPILLENKTGKEKEVLDFQTKYFDSEWSIHKTPLSDWKKTYLKRVKDLFNIKPNKEKLKDLFLDIGVGASGYTVLDMAKNGYNSVGCDISLEGMLKAKKYSELQKLNKKTFWVVCNAEKLPFKNNTFKYICSNSVFEHLPNDKNAFKELNRISTKKAKAYLTVPLKYKYIWPFFLPLVIIFDKNIGHQRRYDYESFNTKIHKTKFKISKVFYTGHIQKASILLLSKVLKTRRWNKLMEKVDSDKLDKKYGAMNISFFIES